MTISNVAGTRNHRDIGMNSSSKVLAARDNREADTLSSNTKKSNPTTTSTVKTPKMNPKHKFNSAASAFTSREDGGSCGTLIEKTCDDVRETVVFATPRSSAVAPESNTDGGVELKLDDGKSTKPSEYDG